MPTLPSPLCRPRRFVAAAAVLLACLGGGPARAALDSSALTDDHSINIPTTWWTYSNQTPQQLADRINEHGARLAGLEVTAVTSAGEPRFTARLVANSGAYAVPDWWWYYDQTPEQITALLNANSGRLIELERYDRGGGQIRYAMVMVANAGDAARGWSYLIGATKAQITSHISATGSRPIDLDAYGSGSARRYTAVFVSNTGADLRPFSWDVDQTPADIAARTNSFQGRVVKLGRQSDGRYLFIQVRNTGSNSSTWWHKYGFASITALDNYARQMGARPVDVTSYSTISGQRFDAAFIDNANAEERRMRGHYAPLIDANQNPRGIFEAYLKEVDGPVLINLNGQRRAESASALKVLHLLHAMKQVHAGIDFLQANNFVYYNSDYADAPEFKDRCPIPDQENTGSWNYNVSTLEWGLDQMMDISDNRTTRGIVLRWGGTFAPFNATAAAAGLTDTTLRHDIGCAYTDLNTSPYTYSPATKRNETTMADLAKIYEGVWAGRLLGSNSLARREFLESAKTGTRATDQVQAIIDEEAAALGKSAIAAEFGALVRTWGKGGKYDACLGDPADATQCGQAVMVRSSAGLMRLPIGGGGPYVAFRYYVHGKLISDVPFSNSMAANVYATAHKKASGELFRGVIREALQTW